MSNVTSTPNPPMPSLALSERIENSVDGGFLRLSKAVDLLEAAVYSPPDQVRKDDEPACAQAVSASRPPLIELLEQLPEQIEGHSFSIAERLERITHRLRGT